MTADIQQLAARIGDSLNDTQDTGAHPWLRNALLKNLADGEPVSVDRLAATTGHTAEEVHEALADLPDTEYDDAGRIVGSGITLNPTPHRFTVDGRTLYTWCALDTLIFPAVLGRTAHVESSCHATAAPVRLTVTPTGVTAIEHSTAVVSIVTPDEMTSLRASFCNHVHFFAGADAARAWLAEHPGMSVLPVADAHQLGRPLARTLLGGETPTSCC